MNDPRGPNRSDAERTRGRILERFRAWFVTGLTRLSAVPRRVAAAVVALLALWLGTSLLLGRLVWWQDLLVLALFIAGWVIVVTVAEANVPIILRTIAGMIWAVEPGASAARARSTLYTLLLAILLLRRADALDAMAGLLPSPILGRTDLLGQTIALVLVAAWASYLGHRYFDATGFAFSDAPLLPRHERRPAAEIMQIVNAMLAACVNVGLPVVLTAAVVNGLDVNPLAEVASFAGYVLQELPTLVPAELPARTP